MGGATALRRVPDLQHVEGPDMITVELPDGLHAGGSAEGVPKVAPRPAGHEGEHRGGGDGGPILEEAIHHLVQRSVAAHRHNPLHPALQRISRECRGCARPHGPVHRERRGDLQEP